jgi:serine/threonine protein kinase
MLDKDVKQVGYNRCVDWWAFGCLLYELLTGKSAFGKPHVRHRNSARAVALLCLLAVRRTLAGTASFPRAVVQDPSHGIYLSIIKNTLTIPPYVNAAARSLLRGLLCTDLTKRIVDVNAIRAHEWFKEVDWVAMYQVRDLTLVSRVVRKRHWRCVRLVWCNQCRAVPPYTPPVTGPEDVQHFDTYSKSDNGDEGTVDKWSNVKRNSPSRSALPASSFADFSGL